MIKQILRHKTLLLVAGTLALSAYFFIPSSTALARETPPGEQVDNLLARGLARLQNAAQHLQGRLDNTTEIVAKGEEWITQLQAEGIDTAVLEDALTTYQDRVDAAQALTSAGQDILDAHAGFDEDGNVTNRQEAATTLRDAGRNLRDGHRELHNASIELRRVVTDFRRNLQENE